MTDFPTRLRDAGITPDKPLHPLLVTIMEAVTQARDAVRDGARGLTPEGEAELVKRVGTAAGAAVRQSVSKVAKSYDFRSTMIAGGITAAIAMASAAGGAYWMQEHQAAAARVTEGRIQAAFTAGPVAAEAWSALMRANDPTAALAACRGDAVRVIDGRRACLVPLWLDPPRLAAPEVRR